MIDRPDGLKIGLCFIGAIIGVSIASRLWSTSVALSVQRMPVQPMPSVTLTKSSSSRPCTPDSSLTAISPASAPGA